MATITLYMTGLGKADLSGNITLVEAVQQMCKCTEAKAAEDEKMLSFDGDYESTKEEMKKKGGYKQNISNFYYSYPYHVKLSLHW